MSRAKKILQQLEARFRVRLVQTADDEYHLETIDGRVVLDDAGLEEIKQQLLDIEAHTEDGVRDPQTIIDDLAQNLPFSSVRGQSITTLLRADNQKFRNLAGKQ